MAESAKPKTVPVFIKNPCPGEAYSVGRYYEVSEKEAKRLSDLGVTGNEPRVKRGSVAEGSQKKAK